MSAEASSTTASTTALGLVGECGDPERMQPFYIMAVCGALKLIATTIVFKIDMLKPVEKLHAEWSDNSCTAQMKRVAAICAQLCFIVMALKTAVADLAEVVQDTQEQNWLQKYQCYTVVWLTSTNFTAGASALFTFLQTKDAMLQPGYDPRPFGRLQAIMFYLKLTYGAIMTYNVALTPGIITHFIPGLLMFSCVGMYELFKLEFLLVTHLFASNSSGLLKEYLLKMWVFVYPCLIVIALGLIAGLVQRFILWWHGVAHVDPLHLRGNVQEGSCEQAQVLVRTEVDEGEMPAPQGQLLESAGSKSERDLDTTVDLNDNRAQHEASMNVGVAWSLMVPVLCSMSVLIAARVYRGAHVYEAISITVTERTVWQYAESIRKSLSGVEVTMKSRLGAIADAVWAIF